MKNINQIDDLKTRIAQLEYIVRETMWMARRYADKRITFAPSTVNKCIDDALRLGVNIEYDRTLEDFYAQDGMFGKWNKEKQKFEKE